MILRHHLFLVFFVDIGLKMAHSKGSSGAFTMSKVA